MIYEGSRYENAVVLRTQAADGESRPTVYSVPPSVYNGMPYRSHVVREGDRYDVLASQLWGDPELWWRIADVNPELLYPGDLPVGTVIRLPLT